MAELLGVLFGEIIFLQQGDLLASAQPQQPRLLIFSDTNVLNGIRGKCFPVSLNGPQLAVPLDIALPTHWEGAYHPFFRSTGHTPGEQIHIGFF